jgi:pimeloyl-ACP methyl ester carboxylesterase
MADLWGLGEALNKQGYRVCSYDMPGIGFSSFAVKGQREFGEGGNGNLMSTVMDAIGEKGPFLLIGSMDGAGDRVYDFALRHPEKVSAVVIANDAAVLNEWALWAAASRPDGKPVSPKATVDYARSTLKGRLGAGWAMAFGACWGLIPLFAPPNPAYVPQRRAREKVFLDVWTEKSWTANVFSGIVQSLEMSDDELLAPRVFANRSIDPDIPVVVMMWNDTRAPYGCVQPPSSSSSEKGGGGGGGGGGFGPSSDLCRQQEKERKILWAEARAVASVNNVSRLVVSEGDDCVDCVSGFDINQNGNIGWFVAQVVGSLGHEVM